MEFQHKSVLLQECIDALNIRPDGIYLDGTLGGAGHSSQIARRLTEGGRLIGVDRDRTALAAAHDIISYHAPFCEKRQRLFCFVRQHTVPLAVFDVKHAELHGKGLDLNILIAELRELVEQ